MASGRNRHCGEIALQEAPEFFFETCAWNRILAACGSREAVLLTLGTANGAVMVHQARLAAESPTIGGARARDAVAAFALAEALATSFMTDLLRGTIRATGLGAQALDRVAIPPGRWSALHPNFLTGTAEGPMSFAGVLLKRAASHDDPFEACVGWLRVRQADGVSLKKQLKAEAEVAFAGLPSRTFDRAYQVVFTKRRGRPSRPPSLPASPRSDTVS